MSHSERVAGGVTLRFDDDDDDGDDSMEEGGK